MGFLGTGAVAGLHGNFIRHVPNAKLVALCDTDAARLQAFAASYPGVETYQSLQEMLRTANLDVAHVLLPPTAHADAAIESLKMGCSVLIEKPMALNTRDCARIQAAAQQNGGTVTVNHNMAFIPAFVKLIRAVQNWELGEVQHVDVVYNMPIPEFRYGIHWHWLYKDFGNLIFELGPHPVSMICKLLGRVTAATTLVTDPHELASGRLFYPRWQSSLACERGTAQLYLSIGGEYTELTVHAVGQDGAATADLSRNTFQKSTSNFRRKPSDDFWDGVQRAQHLVLESSRNYVDSVLAALRLRPCGDALAAGWLGSFNAFYAALGSGAELPVDFEAGRAVVEGCEAIVENAISCNAEGTECNSPSPTTLSSSAV